MKTTIKSIYKTSETTVELIQDEEDSVLMEMRINNKFAGWVCMSEIMALIKVK